MRRTFRPAVSTLEGRLLLSAVPVEGPSRGHPAFAAPAGSPQLRGTISGIGPNILASPTQIYTLRFFLGPSRLGKVQVIGDGFLLPGDPSFRVRQGYDYIEFGTNARKNAGSNVSMSAVTEPVTTGGPEGPVTLEMQVNQANGAFARDLGSLVSVSIAEKPHRGMVGRISVAFSPA